MYQVILEALKHMLSNLKNVKVIFKVLKIYIYISFLVILNNLKMRRVK